MDLKKQAMIQELSQRIQIKKLQKQTKRYLIYFRKKKNQDRIKLSNKQINDLIKKLANLQTRQDQNLQYLYIDSGRDLLIFINFVKDISHQFFRQCVQFVFKDIIPALYGIFQSQDCPRYQIKNEQQYESFIQYPQIIDFMQKITSVQLQDIVNQQFVTLEKQEYKTIFQKYIFKDKYCKEGYQFPEFQNNQEEQEQVNVPLKPIVRKIKKQKRLCYAEQLQEILDKAKNQSNQKQFVINEVKQLEPEAQSKILYFLSKNPNIYI